MKFCGEIQYETSDGGVHSDVCHGCQNDQELKEDNRKFYHDLLDEWLNKSNGTGYFWIGNPETLFGKE